MSNTRNGKIARLPREVREQLNLKLDNGMEAEPVLAWVNELRETQKLVGEHFEGKPINPQNLSGWRQGGYQDWLREQERRELAGLLLEEGEEFEGMVQGANLGHRLGVVFALELAAQLRRWQRETGEPKERWRQLRELFRELAELRREDHRAQRLKIAHEKWAWETEALEEAKQLKLQDASQRKADSLLKELKGALFGCGFSPEARQGEAEVVRAIKSGKPLPEWAQKFRAEREAWEERPETRRLKAAGARWRAREEVQSPKPEVQSREAEKPGGRGPKSEGNPKSETRNPNPEKSGNEDPPSLASYGAASEMEGKGAVRGTTEPKQVQPDQAESDPIKANQTEKVVQSVVADPKAGQLARQEVKSQFARALAEFRARKFQSGEKRAPDGGGGI